MKIPQQPPSQAQLVQKFADNKKFVQLVTSVEATPKEYLHWDDFRFRPTPDGMTLEEWWFIQKFRRGVAGKILPGEGQNRRPFWFVPTDYIQDWLHQFDRQTGSLDAIPKAIDSEPNRQSYLMAALFEEAFTSSVLEGAVTTREQAKEIVRAGRKPRDRSERMILNNYLTMQRLGTLKDEPFSPTLLLNIHRLITEGTLDKPEAAGRFRRSDESVKVMDEIDGTVYFDPPPAELLPAHLMALTNFANEKTPNYYLHPVVRAITLHFWLAYDHPFVDGNGRTARALFYWSMLRAGYPQFEYISISHFIRRAPMQYARAFLHVETDENDLTYFIHFHLRVIDLAMRQLIEHFKKKRCELEEVESHLRRVGDFNHRQQALLVHALKKPRYRYTIQGHKESHGVTYQTARADLLELARVKFLIQSKRAKAFVFTPALDLAEKLRGK